MYSRREALLSITGAAAAVTLSTPIWAQTSSESKVSRLGICTDSYALRFRANKDGGQDKERFTEPLGFLDHCHRLGAGGIQMEIGRQYEGYAARLRRQAETYGMFVEGSAGLPRDQSDLERFEAEVVASKNSGVTVIRVLLSSRASGRRYEAFNTAAEFHDACERGRRMLELAEPVASRHKIRLALENHKDQRVPEMLETLKRVSSEYVGVCVDTGNNIALLEDPMEVIEACAPWAFDVHLKDMAVREYDDGFLLAEVPLGEGILELPKVVKTLRSRHPEVHFSLEMMTRDPLKVPCLTDKYWAAMADVPGRDLARTLKMVQARGRKEALPRISHLPSAEQFAVEEENVRKCLAYARERLDL